MTHYSPYSVSAHLVTHEPPTPVDTPVAPFSAWTLVTQAATSITGAYVAGTLLLAALGIWTGWLVWEFAKALETYRVI